MCPSDEKSRIPSQEGGFNFSDKKHLLLDDSVTELEIDLAYRLRDLQDKGVEVNFVKRCAPRGATAGINPSYQLSISQNSSCDEIKYAIEDAYEHLDAEYRRNERRKVVSRIEHIFGLMNTDAESGSS